MRAAAINPGEIGIREGLLHERWPATFPSGEGSDLAGVVAELGGGRRRLRRRRRGAAAGPTVARATPSSSSSPAEQLIAKPEGLSWEVAGSLYVAPLAAYACVKTVAPAAGEVDRRLGRRGRCRQRRGAARTPAGSDRDRARERAQPRLAALARHRARRPTARARRGASARPPAAASTPSSTRSAAATSTSRSSSACPSRGSTRSPTSPPSSAWASAPRAPRTVASTAVLREIAELAADGSLEIPIARTYPLAQVREAFSDLARRRTHGKIVLVP